MKQLSENVTNILTNATPQTAKQLTPAHGLTQKAEKDGQMSTQMYKPPRRPTQDEAVRVISKLSSLRLWQIKHTDTSEAREAMKVLAWALIPATYEEASYWMTRLMGHYPRMDTDSKAVVVGDVCAAVVKDSISLCAVAYVYDSLWKRCTKEDPWPPQAGQIRNEMLERMDLWRDYYARFSTPKALPVPSPRLHEESNVETWTQKAWEEMDSNDKSKLALHILSLDHKKAEEYRKWRKLPSFDSQEWQECVNLLAALPT